MDPWGAQGEAQLQRWLVPGKGQSKLFPGFHTHGHLTGIGMHTYIDRTEK